ncbi:MAG: hypothetical protein IJ689_01835 [Alphaproteobacteria bacterium]|nr:hypothetical protein [Alphaproteobacteria bacterium]
MKKYILAALSVMLPSTLCAQLPQYQGAYNPNQTLEEYFQAENQNYDKSIIYVFYSNNYCYGCPEAMTMLEKLYDEEFSSLYSFFMIDYQNDDEYNFIATYDLHLPLEVVMVKIEDGEALGYEKIENLQDRISDSVSFNDYVRNRINNFLGQNG